MTNSQDTSKTQEEYLPKCILDMLINRIATKLDYSSTFLIMSMWDKAVAQCQQVELDARNIDSVILSVQSFYDYIDSQKKIRKSHAILTEIYIILSYKHGTDRLYQTCVLPELRKKMSVFAEPKNMDKIKSGIKEVVDFDNLMKHGEGQKEDSDNNNDKNQITSLEKQIERLTSENEQLKKENESLKCDNKLISDDISATEQITWHDKVRLNLLLKFIKNAGANMEIHGNKIKVAKIMNMITGLPLQTCKNYCSDPVLNTTEHMQEIVELNILLEAVGMKDLSLA